MSKVEETPKVMEVKRLPLLPPKWRSFFVVLTVGLVVFLVAISVVVMLLPLNAFPVEGVYAYRQEVHPKIGEWGDMGYMYSEDRQGEYGLRNGELARVNNKYILEYASFDSWAYLKTDTGMTMYIWSTHTLSYHLKIPHITRLFLTPYLKLLQYEGFTEGNCTITHGVVINYMRVYVPDLPSTRFPEDYSQREQPYWHLLTELKFTVQDGNIDKTSFSAETYPLEVELKMKLYNPSLIKLKDLAPNLLIIALVILSVTIVVINVRIPTEDRDR